MSACDCLLPLPTFQKGWSGGVEPAASTFTESRARPLHYDHHRNHCPDQGANYLPETLKKLKVHVEALQIPVQSADPVQIDENALRTLHLRTHAEGDIE